MTPRAINENAVAGPLATRVSEWAAQLVDPYLTRFPRNPHRVPKQVHDPVHKIIELKPWEVFLLDSPLLQRLRFVRQLGVGHLLFPSSGYSRFEHSLGALYTASAIFDAVVNVERQGEDAQAPIYSPERLTARRDVVRLSALLHDIGHCIFSHVSERFYGKAPEVSDAVKQLSDFYGAKVAPSEALSILIVGSAPFRKLMAVARPRRTDFDEDRIVDSISACIAGSKLRTAPDCFMAEIVNGPVDCDKLDYLARDAQMAGVPTSLDIDRLLSKLRLAKIKRLHEPDLYSLAVVPSGARALDELLVSRIFLYDKFYYHPKVMAAEELIRRALYHLAKAIPAFEGPSPLLDYGDDEFLSQTPETLGIKYGCRRDHPEVLAACDLIRRARVRDLPKRAFAFALRYIPEAPELIARFETKGKVLPLTQGLDWFRQLSLLLETQEGKENHARMVESYARELGAASEVFLAAQSAQRAAGSIYLPVILPNGVVEEKPSFLFKTSEWTEAYALNKQTSYVFSYSDLPKVHLAAERMLAEFGEYGQLSFAPNCVLMAKLAPEDVDSARKGLPNEWIAHRLPRDYLSRAPTLEILRKERERLASHLNTIEPKFGLQMIEAWISQFPDPDLQDSALSLVRHVTYVEPSDVIRGFQRIIDQQEKLRTAIWIPLRPRSGRGKSADHLTYDLKELGVSMRTLATPETALRIREAQSLVFFDDSLNSGVQSRCLIVGWFGEAERCEHPNDLDADGALSTELRDAIRDVPVTFVFYSKHPRGEERLRSTCEDLGIGVAQVLSVIDSSREEFRLAGLKCDSVTSRDRFADFLRDVGETLLLSKVRAGEAGWDEARAKRFALGYDELDLTLVYHHTISASTPVALWRMEVGPVISWMPLFPRNREAFRQRIDPANYPPRAPVPEYPA